MASSCRCQEGHIGFPKPKVVINTKGGREGHFRPTSSGVNRVKIVISRKGVDSESGGMASPILPCGCLCSIPIPSTLAEVRYADIKFGKHTLQQISNELNPSWSSHEFAHLDPDLRSKALEKRPENWRAAFGQSGSAAGLLINQSVGDGGV